MKARERIVRLIRLILTYQPYHFNKRTLAIKLEVSEDTIKDDLRFLYWADLEIDTIQKDNNRKYYAIFPEKNFKELAHLKSLSDSEYAKIKTALRSSSYSSKEVDAIERKLATIYDFQKLGIRALRRDALERVDSLEDARKQHRQVILENYTSNSGEVRDRVVECFHVDVEHDTIQAYEPTAGKVKHFRLPRIKRVILTTEPWKFIHLHHRKPTDVFRIADLEQIRVQLKIKSQAYNYLLEYYPQARGETSPASEPDTWYFEAAVNANFYGIVNFIMANSEHVEILFPEELKEVVRLRATALLTKLKK